jgi:hypothetical protein
VENLFSVVKVQVGVILLPKEISNILDRGFIPQERMQKHSGFPREIQVFDPLKRKRGTIHL